MVKELKEEDRTIFLCEKCGLGYADRETAEKCEEWCKKTNTCSIEITRKAALALQEKIFAGNFLHPDEISRISQPFPFEYVKP